MSMCASVFAGCVSVCEKLDASGSESPISRTIYSCNLFPTTLVRICYTGNMQLFCIWFEKLWRIIVGWRDSSARIDDFCLCKTLMDDDFWILLLVVSTISIVDLFVCHRYFLFLVQLLQFVELSMASMIELTTAAVFSNGIDVLVEFGSGDVK